MEMNVFYYPLKSIDNEFLAVTVGDAKLAVGDEVALRDDSTYQQYEGLFVVATDTFRADDMPEGILDVLEVASTEEFLTGLSRTHKTGLPSDVTITLYRFSPEPVVIAEEAEETVEAPVVEEKTNGAKKRKFPGLG